MKILFVNKFLYPNGGSETYIFKLAQKLTSLGHEVQFFGMEHPDRIVGNDLELYTTNMDFRGNSAGLKSKLEKLVYPFKIIYSRESAEKITRILDEMRPDVVHLNNINFQITPSIIPAIRKWEKNSGRHVEIVATIHDPQWVCPNHLMINGRTMEKCSKCFDGDFYHCINGRCIHNSFIKSVIGSMEASLHRVLHTYKQVDKVICPSMFMQKTMNNNPDISASTVFIRNFLDGERAVEEEWIDFCKANGLQSDIKYVVYVGRYSSEKGINTLIEAANLLSDIQFIFAGNGPEEEKINALPNVINVGFVSVRDVALLLKNAKFSIIASDCYENCPFSVMESLDAGTPVIGSNIGGIPELIEDGQTGLLFESGNVQDLIEKIRCLWDNHSLIDEYKSNCKKVKYDSLEEYTKKIIKIYGG